MGCAACVARVEKAIKGVKGVESCAVSLASNSAQVVYDSAVTGPKQISQAVSDAGYELITEGGDEDDESDRRKGRDEARSAGVADGSDTHRAGCPGGSEVCGEASEDGGVETTDDPDELTERLALGDINYTVQQMNALREMGILLAMDDFGTGYSSLSYIQLLPLTLLKLDRSFIIEIETDTVAQEIVSAVIKIAKSMNIETIAEGVEFKGQAAMLRDMGCDYIQGYLYGKPMTAEDFQRRLEINTYGKAIS